MVGKAITDVDDDFVHVEDNPGGIVKMLRFLYHFVSRGCALLYCIKI